MCNGSISELWLCGARHQPRDQHGHQQQAGELLSSRSRGSVTQPDHPTVDKQPPSAMAMDLALGALFLHEGWPTVRTPEELGCAIVVSLLPLNPSRRVGTFIGTGLVLSSIYLSIYLIPLPPSFPPSLHPLSLSLSHTHTQATMDPFPPTTPPHPPTHPPRLVARAERPCLVRCCVRLAR